MATARKKRMDSIRPSKKTTLKKKSQNEIDLGTEGVVLESREPVPAETFMVKKKIKTSFKEYARRHWFWLHYVIKILFLFVCLFFVMNYFDRTDIVVSPHVAYKEIEDSVFIYKNPKEGQLGFDIIALSENISESLVAQGQREKKSKATGTVVLYNRYSNEPQRLLPETRFLSAGGHVFRLSGGDLIIPGKTDDSPGSIEATILAEKEGSEYNIDSTDFTLPGFKDAGLIEKYNGIYAVSVKKFHGGFVGSEPYITEDQKSELEKKLKTELLQRLQKNINQEKTKDFMLLKDSGRVVFKDSQTTFEENGTEGEITQGATIFGLLIGYDQLIEYIKKNYLDIPEGEEVSFWEEQSFDLALTHSDLFDYTTSNQSSISIVGKPFFSWDVDVDQLKESLLSRDKLNTETLLKANNSIDTAEIKIRPFWRKTISDELDRIRVEIIE